MADKPRVTVLKALMATLIEADLPSLTGEPDLKLRFSRNRATVPEELPCLTIRYVSESRQDEQITMNEQVMQMDIDLIVDTDVEPPAVSDGVAYPDLDTEDPTGLQRLSNILDAATEVIRACFAPDPVDTPLANVAWGLTDDGTDEDPESDPEDGRLVGNAGVLYRISPITGALLTNGV